MILLLASDATWLTGLEHFHLVKNLFFSLIYAFWPERLKKLLTITGFLTFLIPVILDKKKDKISNFKF